MWCWHTAWAAWSCRSGECAPAAALHCCARAHACKAAAAASAELATLPACRLRSAALVSKRFAALCGSPKLLRSVDASLLSSLEKLCALTAWLAQHGQHVWRLTFQAPTAQAVAADEGSTAAALVGCLAAAGAGGALQTLTVLEGYVPSTEWLAAMPRRSLRHLSIDSTTAPLISFSFPCASRRPSAGSRHRRPWDSSSPAVPSPLTQAHACRHPSLR